MPRPPNGRHRQHMHGIGLLLTITLVFAGISAVTPAATAAAAPFLTAGFTRIGTDAHQGAGEFIDFVFLPDASGATSRNFLSIGKARGRIMFQDEAGGVRTIAAIPNIHSVNDFGLVSIALAPDYATSRRFAVLATYTSGATHPSGAPAPEGRLDIYTVDNALAPTTASFAKTVLGGISQADGPGGTDSHGPGTVVWAPDGTLFVGFGDASSYSQVDPLALRALDPDDPHGKIHHVDINGNGVAGNPYAGKAAASSWRGRMYASGFRNPFRFSLDPNRTGTLLVGDVGWGTYEKIISLGSGTVGGWPCYEGVFGDGRNRTGGYQDLAQCQGYYSSGTIYQPGTMTPKETISAPGTSLFNFDRSGRGAAIVGGAFYTGDKYPEDYRGAYFFANYPPDSPSMIYTLTTDGTGLTRAPEAGGFGSSLGGPVSIRTGPGGDLYYADLNTGTLWQLKYAQGNRPPEVHVTTTTDADTRTVCFDAATSFDPDDDLLTATTDFGDGASAAGAQVCHVYPGVNYPTTLTAKVTVTDSLGASSSANVTVSPADHAPTLIVVQAPGANQKFAIGAAINVILKVGDAEDGPRPVTQQTAMVHCATATDCHTHYGQPSTLTPDASGNVVFTTKFDDHGQNTSMLLTFTATDSLGVSTTWNYQAYPDLRTITVVSPTNATIDGLETNTLQVAVGSSNTVSVPQRFEDLTFTGWSNGEAANQATFTMPAEDFTLTANYVSAIDTYAASLGGRFGIPTGPETAVAGGRMRPFEYANFYWSPATGVHEVHGAILGMYLSLGGPSSFLGFPVTDEYPTPTKYGAYSVFQGGAIHWSPASGAHETHGAIQAKWADRGWEQQFLGFPLTNELDASPGGRFNVFEGGIILWSPGTGAHEVHGAIRGTYDSLGGSTGFLRFPVTDETPTPTKYGAYSAFTGGAIHWSPATGAHETHGAIAGKWASLGWEQGFLGFPTSNEIPTPTKYGAYHHFEGAMIYWSPASGAHEVHGAILATWASLGYEQGRLGFPVRDEYGIPGGARSDFQGGSILWLPGSGGAHVVYA